MSIGIDAMAAAAKKSGCSHVKFDQMKTIEDIKEYTDDNDQGKHGICYGLSVCWLEAQKKGKAGSFFTDLAKLDMTKKDSPGVALLNRARQIYIMQKDTLKDVATKSVQLKWQKLVGLEMALDKEGDRKSTRLNSSH